MKTTTRFTLMPSTFLMLLYCSMCNISAAELARNSQIRQLIQDYNNLESRVRENQGAELVSSPQPEHISRARESLSPYSRHTTEELYQFAQKAQSTYCTILSWASCGYRGESPNITYTLAYRDSQLARIQGSFYYKAALFVNSELRHNCEDFRVFGQEASPLIRNLHNLVKQKIEEQNQEIS